MIDFFLVGAPKAGTTSVYKHLSQNPGIFVPEVKEPNHYTDVGPNARNVSNVKEKSKYLKLYTKALPEQVKGDFSVSYMHDAGAYLKIKAENPDAKIIMIIRHPVQRAYSHWLMDKREGFVKKDFFEEFMLDINYKGKRGFCYNSMYYDCGLYFEAIEKFRSQFSDVLILVYEEIFKDIQKSLSDIGDFLNISSTTKPTTMKFNESGEVKNKFYKALYRNKVLRKVLKKLLREDLKVFLRGRIIEKSDARISEEDFKKTAVYFIDDVIKIRKLLNKPNLWSDIQ